MSDPTLALTYSLPAIRELLAALGYPLEDYPEDKRVAIFWGPGDEAYYSNGRVEATAEWDAYLTYFDFPPLRMLVGENRWKLGSSESPATHWLVLNLQDGTGVLMNWIAAKRLLRSQWQSPDSVPVPPPSPEEIDKISEEIFFAYTEAVKQLNQEYREHPEVWEAQIRMYRENHLRFMLELTNALEQWLKGRIENGVEHD